MWAGRTCAVPLGSMQRGRIGSSPLAAGFLTAGVPTPPISLRGGMGQAIWGLG